MKKFTKDLQHYLPLLGILCATIFGFWLLSYDKLLQIALTFAASAAYLSWGIVHHFIHEDLHLSVVIEYLLVSALGLIIILSIIFRS